MADEEKEEVQEKPKGGMMKMIIVAVVMLAAGGGGVFYAMQSGLIGGTAEAAETESNPEVPPPPAPGTAAGMIPIESFLTNIGGSHHARLEVKLAVVPDTRATEIEADAVTMARIRDQILTQLGSKTYGEISTPQGRLQFKQELHDAISELIVGASLEDVLFADFVVQ